MACDDDKGVKMCVETLLLMMRRRRMIMMMMMTLLPLFSGGFEGIS